MTKFAFRYIPHARRAPSCFVAVLAAALLAAGCAGRTRAPGAPGKPAATPKDSAARVAVMDSVRRDSAAVARPVTPVTVTPDTAKRPVTPADSARRVAADSAARADSLNARRVAAKKPAPATRNCVLDFTESPDETRFYYMTLPDGNSNTFLGGGFVGHCQGERNRLRADSAEQYGGQGVMNLFGNVVYEEPGKMRVQAMNAVYFTREQRLVATGNVTATSLASGSTFTGPSIEYYRPLAGVRTTSKLVAPNRPTATVIEKDSTGKPGLPITIIANTMHDEGDTLLFAWGAVIIKRNNITGEGDSATYEKLTERARLIRQARVTNSDTSQAFRLVGDTIDMFNKERRVERVLALHNANASNADFVLRSERIDLRLVDQKLNRAYASGTGRSKATTRQQELDADSLDIMLPGQRVSEVRALGGAIATGVPDSLKLKSEDRDVLRGDTVIAHFDTAKVVGDTSRRTRVREIEAQGNASSLYQAPSKQGPSFPPAVNYLRAKQIVIAFDSGEVRHVTADSSASGLYLEPVTDSLADSSAARKPPARGGAPATQRPPATPVRPPVKPPVSAPTPIKRS
jgi:lipopolysaccharide export system protein LptA